MNYEINLNMNTMIFDEKAFAAMKQMVEALMNIYNQLESAAYPAEVILEELNEVEISAASYTCHVNMDLRSGAVLLGEIAGRIKEIIRSGKNGQTEMKAIEQVLRSAIRCIHAIENLYRDMQNLFQFSPD